MRVLGIDIGTTTISMALWDAEQGMIEKSYTISNDSFIDTKNEWEKIQDPEQIIWKVFQKFSEINREFTDIQVIGLTGQMHGIVYLDENGNHVSPLYTWQDQRGLQQAVNGKSICELTEEVTDLKVSAGYGLVTHLFNLKTGQVPEKAVQISTIMDYLGMKLTGRRRPLMHSSNAASLGFFDVEQGRFMKEEIEQMGADVNILPEVTEDFQLLGEYQGIPVGIAIGDNQASFLGSVREAKNEILVNMGTGGQISVLADTCFTAGEIETRPFVRGKYLLVGASLCGGRAYAVLANFFSLTAQAMGVENINSFELMDQLLKNMADCERMVINTAFSGTRNEPERRGTITHITEANFRPDILTYGILDGMAEELYSMYHCIEEGIHIKKSIMRASGNGLRRNMWLQQIMKEKFHMEIMMAENAEEAAVGAALCGVIATGKKTLKETIGC